MNQVGRKESRIKDFDPGHSSCPLIDLIACFLGILKSGSYCHPPGVSQEGYSSTGSVLPSFLSGTGPCCAHILDCSSFSIHRNPLSGLGFRVPVADTFSSREGGS